MGQVWKSHCRTRSSVEHDTIFDNLKIRFGLNSIDAQFCSGIKWDRLMTMSPLDA